jgi:hypothetical protein
MVAGTIVHVFSIGDSDSALESNIRVVAGREWNSNELHSLQHVLFIISPLAPVDTRGRYQNFAFTPK